MHFHSKQIWDAGGYIITNPLDPQLERGHMDIIYQPIHDNKDYTRRNRFTGEAIELTKEQAEKHDQIFYHEARATLEDKELGEGVSKHWDKMQKLLDWFRGDKKNIKAYMVLLD